MIAAALRDGHDAGDADRPAAGASGDLFALGRAALAERARRHDDRAVFARSRRLLGSGVWRGPRDAAMSYVEEQDLPALGGVAAAIAAGVDALVADAESVLLASADVRGLRLLARLRYRAGEAAAARAARVAALAARLRAGAPVDGVVPTPDGEPLGLDSLRVFAACRLEMDVSHLVADFAILGHRLAQMALGFGADELLGPIMPERALRLGANSGNPVMTRKEAAILIRGAGLAPWERTSAGLEAFA